MTSEKKKLNGPPVWILLIPLLCLLSCQAKERSPSSAEKPVVAVEDLKPEVAFQGRIIFQSDLDGDNEIYLLTSGGLTQLTVNSWEDIYPRWSPDGKRVAYASNPEGKFDIYVLEIGEGKPVRATNFSGETRDLAWFADGKRLLFSEEHKRGLGRHSDLWVVDVKTGKREKLISDFSGTNFLGDPSPRAPVVAFTGKRLRGWDVFLYDMEGKATRELVQGGKSCRPRFSPDGQRIAYVSSVADGKGDIWTMTWEGRDQKRLTERDATYDYFPSWSPDGSAIVFCSNAKSGYADQGEWKLFLVDVETKLVRPLFDSPGRDVFPDWAN